MYNMYDFKNKNGQRAVQSILFCQFYIQQQIQNEHLMSANPQHPIDQKYRQVLSVADPDQHLMEKYSSVIENDNEQLQVCRMYLYHLALKDKIALLQQDIHQLNDKIKLNSTLPTTPKKPSRDHQRSFRQQEYSQPSNQNTNRQKRVRRTANQISRHFQCPVQTCRKQYGSQGSLNQHIKLKHEFLVRVYDSWAVDEREDIKYEE